MIVSNETFTCQRLQSGLQITHEFYWGGVGLVLSRGDLGLQYYMSSTLHLRAVLYK